MSRLTLLFWQLMVAVVALSLWQFLATVPVFGRILLPPFFFSNPVDVASQIVKWFTTGVIWKHLVITLWESVLAFVIGSVGGVLVGFWFARQPRVAAVFDPYVKMVNALPRVVLAPIFTLWLGLGIWSKVALGVTLVFFIVFFNVYQGVKEVSQTVLDNGRMLGMSERQLTRHVYWPSALSWMFSSLHTSVGFAVVGAVVGEYLGSAAGLGYLIQQAEGVFDVAAVFAGMFVLSAFVILIDMARDAGRAAAFGVAAGRGGGQGLTREIVGWAKRSVPTIHDRSKNMVGTARSTFAHPTFSRHCEERSDEAIHFSACGAMDCFASLAMTAERPPARQFNIFVSSGACGGVLIAIALMVRPSGLVPACGVPFGMMTRSPGFTVTSLSPSQTVPVPSRMNWISLALACMCLPGCRPGSRWSCRQPRRTTCCACRWLSGMRCLSPSSSPVVMTCAVMFSAAIAGRSRWVTLQPAAKAAASDSVMATRFMGSPPLC